MARKFLYAVAVLIVLAIAAAFALRIWWSDFFEAALVPSTEFVEQHPLAGSAYHDPAMWFSRPGFGAPKDPARWQPSEVDGGATEEGRPSPDGGGEPPEFAVFFIHPTSFLENTGWNAALDDAETRRRARTFVKGMASPFNQASEIWAPRYRQAAFGAFLTDAPEAAKAIDAAYRDVSQAFNYFLDSIDADTPIVLAGHSQGARHVVQLLRERIAGTPLEDRIALAYPIGWPISIEHDLPALGLPACATPDQAGCIVTWSSFAEPAEPEEWLEIYRSSPGFDGELRADSPVLCVNPLTGTLNGTAEVAANLGTLVPNDELTTGRLVPGIVPARCDARGLLLIGDPPELGPYMLPGNNFHVYDIPLFWRNLQQDVARRMSTWPAQ